ASDIAEIVERGRDTALIVDSAKQREAFAAVTLSRLRLSLIERDEPQIVQRLSGTVHVVACPRDGQTPFVERFCLGIVALLTSEIGCTIQRARECWVARGAGCANGRLQPAQTLTQIAACGPEAPE